MRSLLLLLSLLPFYLVAQVAENEADEAIPDRDGLRVGLTLQFDGNTTENYTVKNADYVPYYSRRMLVSGQVSWQPFRSNRGVRLQWKTAYDNFTFKGSNILLEHTRFGEDFREEINYRHLQNAFGLWLETSPDKPYTLYFSGDILLSIPLSTSYEATRSPSDDLPPFVYVDGGANISRGYELGAGVRLMASEHWLIGFGIYYARQNIGVNWPDITGRPFREDIILRTKTLGMQLSWQYQW